MHWPTYSLRGEMQSPWLELVMVLAAVICGAIVGTERERMDKPAGLRTLILVCLGSTVFTIVSYAFGTTTGDTGRVAAQIVTGIGFLGAGAILHSRTSVSGMTTAAAIWMTAGIGMTIGVGRPLPGLGLAVLVRVVLAGVRRWEIRHLGGLQTKVIELVFDPDGGKTRIRLNRALATFHVQNTLEVSQEQNVHRARIELHLPERQLHELLGDLAEVPGVREIRELTR